MNLESVIESFTITIKSPIINIIELAKQLQVSDELKCIIINTKDQQFHKCKLSNHSKKTNSLGFNNSLNFKIVYPTFKLSCRLFSNQVMHIICISKIFILDINDTITRIFNTLNISCEYEIKKMLYTREAYKFDHRIDMVKLDEYLTKNNLNFKKNGLVYSLNNSLISPNALMIHHTSKQDKENIINLLEHFMEYKIEVNYNTYGQNNKQITSSDDFFTINISI